MIKLEYRLFERKGNPQSIEMLWNEWRLTLLHGPLSDILKQCGTLGKRFPCLKQKSILMVEFEPATILEEQQLVDYPHHFPNSVPVQISRISKNLSDLFS